MKSNAPRVPDCTNFNYDGTINITWQAPWRRVTVIGFDHGYVRVLGDGKETTVFIVNIDSGWDEWVGGKWRERVPR